MPPSLHELNVYDELAFARFLEYRFLMKYGSDPIGRQEAFNFRYLGVGLCESHLDAIQKLFSLLSENSKTIFRKSLAMVFRHTRPGDFPSDGIRDIILLAQATQAFEVIGAFIPMIGNGRWGEARQSLMYDAISALLMCQSSEIAYRTTKGLVTSRYFEDRYSLEAYRIFVRCHPENWSEDLILLEERFRRYREKIARDNIGDHLAILDRRFDELARVVANAVPVSEIALQLSELQIPYGATSFIDRLFFNPDDPVERPLEIDDQDGIWFVVNRLDRALRVAFQPSPRIKTYLTTRSLRVIAWSDHHHIDSNKYTGFLGIWGPRGRTGIS